MAQLTDTHCHLNLNQFKNDIEQVIQRAQDQGVTRILVPGIDIDTSRESLRLSDRYPIVYSAVGIHPNTPIKWNRATEQEILKMATHPKVVAIGEIGLDYFRDHSPRSDQIFLLEKQLELAAQVAKPVVIHNRDAMQDLWPILSGWQNQLAQKKEPLAKNPGVMHSFSGDQTMAASAVSQNFYIGISGPVTFINARAHQKVVTQIPLESILVETDSPYLTPHPHRGARNEPSYVKLVVEKISLLKGVSYQAVADCTAANASTLFSWRSSD